VEKLLERPVWFKQRETKGRKRGCEKGCPRTTAGCLHSKDRDRRGTAKNLRGRNFLCTKGGQSGLREKREAKGGSRGHGRGPHDAVTSFRVGRRALQEERSEKLGEKKL